MSLVLSGVLCPCRHLGCPGTIELRGWVNALLYIAPTACQRRILLKDFPPHSTIQAYFYKWREAGLWHTISNTLVMVAHEQADNYSAIASTKSRYTRANRTGRDYVLGRGGKQFASGDSMSAMFKLWCKDAGLPLLSAHSACKGLAELLAEQTCSQYEIMAILGHSEVKTSEVYTRRAERLKLALGVWSE